MRKKRFIWQKYKIIGLLIIPLWYKYPKYWWFWLILLILIIKNPVIFGEKEEKQARGVEIKAGDMNSLKKVMEIKQEYLTEKEALLLSLKKSLIIKETLKKNKNEKGERQLLPEEKALIDHYILGISRTMDEIAESQLGWSKKDVPSRANLIIKHYLLIKKHGYRNIAEYIFDRFRDVCLSRSQDKNEFNQI